MGTQWWRISLGRDPVSMGTHLAGVLLGLVATVVLLRRVRRNGRPGLGVGMYGLLMTLAFSASALFHYVDAGSPRFELYNKLDHVAIFLMIAGTGTAIYSALQMGRMERSGGRSVCFCSGPPSTMHSSIGIVCRPVGTLPAPFGSEVASYRGPRSARNLSRHRCMRMRPSFVSPHSLCGSFS